MTDTFTMHDVNDILAKMGAFEPCAWYNPEADQLNFLAEDVQFVSRRAGRVITLFVGMDSGELVGFKIKGFRALYTEISQKLRGEAGSEESFILLIRFLDELFFSHVRDWDYDLQMTVREMTRGQPLPEPNAA